MKSPTLFGYTSKEKKRWVLCAVVCVLDLSPMLEFKQAGCLFCTRSFRENVHISPVCSFQENVKFLQFLSFFATRMSSNTGEDVKLCGACVLAASERN